MGIKVVSLNSASEIALLKSMYKRVEFVPVQRDAREECGKPMVYLSDILGYLKNTGCEICGIINSDIVLRMPDGFLDFIEDQARSMFLFASRIDIDSEQDTTGTVYWGGFDFFLFHRNLIESIPESRFCLGQPWWDYWFPIQAGSHYPLRILATNFAYHTRHDMRWDTNNNYEKYGLHFMEFFTDPPSFQLIQEMYNNNIQEFRQFLGGKVCADCREKLYFAGTEWISYGKRM